MMPLVFFIFLFLLVTAVPNVQAQSPSMAPATSLNPTTSRPSSAPVTAKPTDIECRNTPYWFYEFWGYNSCLWELQALDCDDERVGCWDYGNLGAANFNCCKCKPQCRGQCNDPIAVDPTTTDDYSGCNPNSGSGIYSDDNYNRDDFVTSNVLILAGIALGVCFCLGCVLQRCNNRGQFDARREATRSTMAARRQRQRESNSLGLTEEERSHARYALFKTKFHFQTVSPGKSNISARNLRNSSKRDVEQNDDDDASVFSSVSKRLSAASWRKPTSKDECCICLEGYSAGETICAPITTECNHVFHEACILQWVKNNDKCPLCRVELLKD